MGSGIVVVEGVAAGVYELDDIFEFCTVVSSRLGHLRYQDGDAYPTTAVQSAWWMRTNYIL